MPGIDCVVGCSPYTQLKNGEKEVLLGMWDSYRLPWIATVQVKLELFQPIFAIFKLLTTDPKSFQST